MQSKPAHLVRRHLLSSARRRERTPVLRMGRDTRERPSAFELVTRRGLDDLTERVARLETQMTAMAVALATAVFAELFKVLGK